MEDFIEALANVMVEARLVEKYREETDRKEWALVSRKKPVRVLKWFGPRKPSAEKVAEQERRIQYFKHLNS